MRTTFVPGVGHSAPALSKGGSYRRRLDRWPLGAVQEAILGQWLTELPADVRRAGDERNFPNFPKVVGPLTHPQMHPRARVRPPPPHPSVPTFLPRPPPPLPARSKFHGIWGRLNVKPVRACRGVEATRAECCTCEVSTLPFHWEVVGVWVAAEPAGP